MTFYLDLKPRPLAEVLARKTCGGCSYKADPSMPIAVCRWHDIAVERATPACSEYAPAEDDGPDDDGDVGSAGAGESIPACCYCGTLLAVGEVGACVECVREHEEPER